MAEIVQQFYPSDDIADDLRNVDRDFKPGEYGEVVLKLDPELAVESEKDNIIASAESMSQFLREDGLMAWPGKQPVEVDWTNRTVHIYFVAQEEPSSYYTPSLAFALFPIVTTMVRAAPMAARASGLAWLARFSPGRIFATMKATIIAAKGRFPFLFKTSTLVVGGVLIWAMVDPDSLITVIKHIAGAAADVAKPFLTPILIGVGVMLVGVVALTRSK